MEMKRLSYIAGPVLLAALSLAGCRTARPDSNCPTWTYENQAQWGRLCPEYKECNGPTQSPRPLAPNRAESLPILDAQYARSPFVVKNNRPHYTIEAKAGREAKNLLVIGDTTYRLDEIHFHSPSEHRPPNGRPFAMEIHLLHKNVKNEKDLAVLGVFIEEVAGAPNNQAFEQILENIGKDEIQMDPAVLLPPNLPRLDFRYLGSKTTPPCDPGVRWHVLVEPIMVPPIQINAYKKLYDHTARDPQRNTNPVFEVKPAGATP